MNEDRILTITDENGQEVKIEVLEIFNLNEYPGKEYILYTKNEKTDDEDVKAYISIINETEDYIDLTPITDDEEYSIVENYIHNIPSDIEE